MRSYKVLLVIITLGLVSSLTFGCVQSSNFTFFSASLPAAANTNNSDSGSLNTDNPGIIAVLEAKIRPSVVSVNADTVTYDNSGNQVVNSLAGTGWIYGAEGLIVTNNHVVAGATKVSVTMYNGITYDAKIVRADSVDDIAVIDISVGGFPVLGLGDSSAMAVGDFVMTVGNALGKEIKASTGIISGTGVTFKVDSRETLYDTFEITSPITYGNSGGPLVNMSGQVVGITSGGTLNLAGQELAGYAITSNNAKPVIRDLIDNGYVEQSWLGVTVSNISDLKSLGFDFAIGNGEYVLQVTGESPAGESGLQPGDIIVSFNGKSTHDTDDLVNMVRCCGIGLPVQITYLRDGVLTAVDIVLVQNPALN